MNIQPGDIVDGRYKVITEVIHRFDLALVYAKKMLEYESIRSSTSYRIMWTFRLAQNCFLCHKQDDGNKALAEGLNVLKEVDESSKQLEGQFYYVWALRVKGDFQLALSTLDDIIASASDPRQTVTLLSAMTMRVVVLDKLGKTDQAISGMIELHKVAQGSTLTKELRQALILAIQNNRQTKMDYIIEHSLGTKLSRPEWEELVSILSKSYDAMESARDKDRLLQSLRKFKQLANQTARGESSS